MVRDIIAIRLEKTSSTVDRIQHVVARENVPLLSV